MASPEEIPVYEGQAAVERAYTQAQQSQRPFFGIEQYEEGYAVTYDLLPANAKLTRPAARELQVQLTSELEAIVGDADLPSVEVGKSVSQELGNVSLLDSREAAIRVAQVVAAIALDETNWVDQ